MAESVFLRPISIAFAIVTLIESIIWGVFSFLAILCYLDSIKYDGSQNYGLNAFMNNLYWLYLSEIQYSKKDRLVTPDIFYVLMWIYFLLSLFLCFASGIHIAVLSQKSNIRKINVSTIVWQTFTYLVCLYDIIACILFSIDYHLLRGSIREDSAETEVFLAVILTFVVLSAKGFVLWIVNFVFSVIVTVLFTRKIKVNNEPILSSGPEIHARNYSAYNAYGDFTIDDDDIINNNKVDNVEDTDSRPDELTESTAPYAPMEDSTWFTKLATETSRRSYTSALSERGASPSNDEVLTTNGTLSRIPRASSFRQPRSLAASLSPSPVPPPSKESPRSGRKSAPPDMWNRENEYSSGYKNENDDREEDEYTYDDDDDDDDDDISESMSKMTRVFPRHRRFNLDEPVPDYDKKVIL